MFLCFTTTLDIPHMHRSLCEFAHNGISSSRRISPCLRPFGCCGGRRVPGPFHRGIFITFMVYRFQSLDASKRTHTHTIDKMQSAKRNTCNVTRLCIDEKNSTVHRCVSCRLDLSSFVPDFASLDLLLPTHSFSTSGLVPSSTEYASWTTVHSHF